jgi:phospholipid/cholesterol/gamma-HCH transport system substrate-binding protein
VPNCRTHAAVQDGGEIFERGGPYLARAAADLVPTSALLDTYSPEIFCTIRNYRDASFKAAKILGGNGYSSASHLSLVLPLTDTCIPITCRE